LIHDHSATNFDSDKLVGRAAEGDARAFRALYEAYAPPLYRFALFRVRNPADAEDIVQRVFEKIIEALPRYEQRGLPFRAWLFRIARNAVIDFQRTRHDGEPLDMLTFRASTELGPDALAEAEAERQELITAIRTLTPDQQEVIAYRFFGGLTPGEIAEVMGKRDGSIRALQFRAIESLRATLGQADAQPESAEPSPKIASGALEVVTGALLAADFTSERVSPDEAAEA
jgi:RNA polymerase sigma-70 factor, ECF subfamily